MANYLLAKFAGSSGEVDDYVVGARILHDEFAKLEDCYSKSALEKGMTLLEV